MSHALSSLPLQTAQETATGRVQSVNHVIGVSSSRLGRQSFFHMAAPTQRQWFSCYNPILRPPKHRSDGMTNSKRVASVVTHLMPSAIPFTWQDQHNGIALVANHLTPTTTSSARLNQHNSSTASVATHSSMPTSTPSHFGTNTKARLQLLHTHLVPAATSFSRQHKDTYSSVAIHRIPNATPSTR